MNVQSYCRDFNFNILAGLDLDTAMSAAADGHDMIRIPVPTNFSPQRSLAELRGEQRVQCNNWYGLCGLKRYELAAPPQIKLPELIDHRPANSKCWS